MKIIFFGLGSIGQRHLRLTREHFKQNAEFFTMRSGKTDSATPNGVRELATWDEVKKAAPNIAFICNPTALHVETALECARLGVHLFIEKPIGATLKGLEELIAEVKRRGLVAYVAYPLRFHPAVEAFRAEVASARSGHARTVVSSYLPDWRPGTQWRKSYSASSSMGGGVILDLSHEFDLMQHLFGPVSKIRGQAGRLSDVTLDAEDYADAFFKAGDVTVNLHMNFFSKNTERSVTVDLPERTLKLDLIAGTVASSTGGTRTYPNERDLMFSKQLEYFFSHLSNPELMNNLAGASALFERILEFKESVRHASQ